MRIPSTASLLRSFALLLGTVGLLWSANGFAVDPRNWGAPGQPIRQGHHIEWQRAAYRNDADGYTLLVWSDTRTGDRDVFAQLIEPDGDLAPGWPVHVVNWPFRQEDPEPVPVDGGFIIAWIDFRFDSTGDVLAQKLDYAGNHLWPVEGVIVDTFVRASDSGVLETTLRAAHDGQGGAIIAWESDMRGDPDIYAQRILANGTRAWAQRLAVTDHNGAQSGITADGDGQGNMILGWVDLRTNEQDVFGAKVTRDGTLPWGGVGGIPICTAAERQTSAKICPDLTTGGAYYAWRDERTSTSDDLYMQRVSANGTPLWQANGIVLSDANEEQIGVRIAVSMNGGQQDGVITCWDDLRVNGSISEIYGQKTNASGVHQWTPNGVKVCGDAEPFGGYTRDNSRLTSDLQGGALFIWEDTRNAVGQVTEYDLYMSRVNAAGELACGDCGQLIKDGPNQQQEAVLRTNGDGTEVFIIYRDYYRGSSTLSVDRARISDCVREGGREIIYGLDGDATNPTNIEMVHGIVAFAWEDNRGLGFGKQIYYQVIDTPYVYPFADVIPPNGAPLAPDNSGLTRYSQEQPWVCSDGANGFFCSFIDNRAGTKQVRLQRVGVGGGLLCDQAGAIVSASNVDQNTARIISDNQGGCYVVWAGYDEGFQLDVFALRMNSNCEPLWPEPVSLSNNDEDDDQLQGVSIDENGCIAVVWQTGTFGNYDIWGAKLCADGEVAWRRVICGAPREQSESQVIYDGQGGFYFAWADGRDETQGKDIYANRFDANGNLAPSWTAENGRLVGNAANDQKKPRLATDSQHNLYVVWEDFRSGNQLDIYGQKLSPAGARLWTDQVSGRPLSGSTSNQSDLEMLVEWNDGIYMVWVDETSSYSDLYGVHIDAGGNIADPWWGNAQNPVGGVVNNEYQNQTAPCLAHDYHGGTMVGWVDWRSSGKEPLQNIWGNWINDYTVSVRELPAPLPRDYMLTQNFPNPFNPSTQFRFTVPATEAVKISVFNTLGQQVRTLVDEVMRAGTYEVYFDASELSSGVYFYRLETPTFETVKKMQLIK